MANRTFEQKIAEKRKQLIEQADENHINKFGQNNNHLSVNKNNDNNPLGKSFLVGFILILITSIIISLIFANRPIQIIENTTPKVVYIENYPELNGREDCITLEYNDSNIQIICGEEFSNGN